MIGNIISQLIVPYIENILQQYLENFDSKNLNIGAGDVLLQNLKLKTFALDNIHPSMPVVIAYGFLGSLKVKIPWLHLQTQPVTCEISNVFLVLKPKKCVTYDKPVEDRRMQELKQQALKEYELRRNVKENDAKEKKKKSNDGFVDKLIETILNNLIVNVSDVHIRYEDALMPSAPFSVGLTLETIEVRSTDMHFKQAFMKTIEELTFKLLNMKNFAMYINNNENPSKDFISLMQNVTNENIRQILQSSINNNNHQYILSPVNATVRLKMQKISRNTDFSKPQFDVEVDFDDLMFMTDDKQYRSVIKMLEYLTQYPSQEQYRKYRPKLAVTNDKMGWWKYALFSVRENVSQKKLTWEKLKTRRDDRKLYIKLYKKYVEVPWEPAMTEIEEKRFKDLERKYSSEDLIFFRRIARAEIKVEAKQHETWKESQKSQKIKKWFSFGADSSSSIPAAGIIRITEEERQEIYNSVGFDSATTVKPPSNYVKATFKLHLARGSVAIRNEAASSMIAQLVFEELNTNVAVMDDSIQVLLNVADCTILDKSNPKTIFPRILCRRTSARSNLLSLFMEKARGTIDPSVSKPDFTLRVKLDRMDVVLNLKLIQKVMNFMAMDGSVNFSNLEKVAKQQIDKAKVLAREEIKLALENKKVVHLHFDLMAPNIIIPVDVERPDTKFLLFDLGHLKLNSDTDPERLKRVRKEEEVTETDYFDKFLFTLSDVQVLLPTVPATEYFAADPQSFKKVVNNNVIEKVSCQVDVAKSIVPHLVHVNRFNIKSEIPQVEVKLSPEKFEVFIDIANQLMAFADDPMGSSKVNVKLASPAKVKAAITRNKWKRCWVELKTSKRLYIYDSEQKSNFVAIIKLNKSTKVMDIPTDETRLQVEFQHANQTVSMLVECPDKETRKKITTTARTMILQYETDFNVSKFAKMLVDTKSSKQDETSIIVTRSSEQKIVNASFTLKQLSVVIHDKQSEMQLMDFVFSDLLSTFQYRAHDILLKFNLQQLTVKDLFTSSLTTKNILETSNSEHSLAEMSLTIAREKSPLFSSDSYMQLDVGFQSVNIFAEPIMLAQFVKLGYDLRDVFDRIDKRHNIFETFKTLQYKASLSRIIAASKQQNLESTARKHPALIRWSNKMGKSTLYLLNNNTKVAGLSVSGAKVDIRLGLKELHVSGDLGDVIFQDLIIQDSLYSQILGLNNSQQGSLITFSFLQKFKSDEKVDDFNKFLTLRMSSVRYVHIQKVVKILMHVFQRPLREAIQQERLRAAPSATIEQLKTFAGEQLSNLAKSNFVKYDIELDAPEIVLPAHYLSSSCFTANLGKLTFTNLLEIETKQLIYDIRLSSMSLSTSLESNQLTATSSSELQAVPYTVEALSNINVVIKVVKSLETEEVGVNIEFSDLNFKMSQHQYQLIFDVVDNNFKQTEVEFLSSITTYTKAVADKQETFDQESSSSTLTSPASSVSLLSDEMENEVRVKSDVQVFVPHMKAILLRGSGLDEHGRENPLAQLHVKALLVRNIAKTDKSNSLQIKLHSMVATDARRDTENKYLTIFDSRSENQNENCVDFQMVQDTSMQSFKLFLSDPKFVFVPEVVLEVKDFFTPKRKAEEVVEEVQSEPDLSLSVETPTTPSSPSSGRPLSPAQFPAPKRRAKTKDIYVEARCGQPEIVFPEESASPSSRLLVLQFAMDMKYQRVNNFENGILQAHHITAYITYNNTPLNSTTIVEPMEINANLTTITQSTLNAEAIIDGPMRDISVELVKGGKARISYTDIKTIYTIVKKFGVGSEQSSQVQPVKQKKQKDSQFSALQAEITAKLNEDLTKEHFFIKVLVQSTNELALWVVDDISGNDIPLLDFHTTDVKCLATIQQTNILHILAEADFKMNANYFNFKIAEWEPILERTDLIRITYERSPVKVLQRDSSQEVSSALRLVVNENQQNSESSVQYTDAIQVQSNLIDFNVTHSMIDTVVKTTKLWLKGLESQNPVVPIRFEPYAIRNETGLEVKYWKEGNVEKALYLNKGMECRFAFPSGDQFQQAIAKHYIFIEIAGVNKKILVNKVKTYTYTFNKNLVTVQIELLNGRKIITLHSGVKVVNNSSEPWHIGCFTPSHSTGELAKKVVLLGKLEPAQSLFVPCEYIQSNYVFTIKPSKIAEYKWVKKSPEFGFQSLVVPSSKGHGNVRLMKCRNIESNNKMFHAILKINRENSRTSTNVSLEITPPLALENLLAYDMEFILFTPSVSTDSINGVYMGSLKSLEKTYIYTISAKEDLKVRVKIAKKWNTKDYSLIYSADPKATLADRFTNTDEQGKVLPVRIDYCVTGQAFHEVSFYCSYWIVNLTSRKIDVRIGSTTVAGHNLLNQRAAKPESNSGDLIAIDQAPAKVHDVVQDFAKIAHCPLMFDYPSGSILRSNKINILVDNKYASQDFSIDTAGASGDIEAKDEKSIVNIGLFVKLGPGKFQRTKFVILTPRYVIKNLTGEAIHVRQSQFSESSAVEPFDPAQSNYFHFYWTGLTQIPMVQVQWNDTEWSIPFRVNVLGEIPLILHKRQSPTGEQRYILIQVHQENGIVYIIFEKANNPPYFLENQLDVDVQVCQQNTSRWVHVPSKSKVPYSWSSSFNKHSLIVQLPGTNLTKTTFTVELDVIANKQDVYDKARKKKVYVKISAQGYTRILKLTEEKQLSIKSRTKSKRVLMSLPNEEHYKVQLFFSIEGIGISIIDNTPRELIYVLFENILCKYTLSDLNQYVELKVKRVQVNNQLPNAVFPVALTNTNKLENKEFIHLQLVESLKEKSYKSYPYFGFMAQEMDLAVDFDFVNRIVTFITDIMTAHFPQEDERTALQNMLLTPIPSPSITNSQQLGEKDRRKLYFSLFQIFAIKFNFSFVFQSSKLDTATSNSSSSSATSKSSIEKRNRTLTFMQTLGANLNANIDEVPISLKELMLENPFLSKQAFAEVISNHYGRNAIAEMYKIIGSFDFIGNPVGLFNDIDTGVYSLMYEPFESITKSSGEFTKGLLKGSVNFAKHSIHGAFNTTTKVTESIGNTLSLFSFDNEYIHQRQEKHMKKKPRHFGEGLLSGAEALTSGLFEGTTGIIVKPYVGAKEQGVSGFFKGVVQGVVGIPTKPVTALFDFASRASEGIRNTTTYFSKEEKKRSRKPRVFGVDGKVIPYDSHSSEGQDMLNDILFSSNFERRPKAASDSDSLFNQLEAYVCHGFLLQSQKVIMVSNQHIFCANGPTGDLDWWHPLHDIESVQKIIASENSRQQPAASSSATTTTTISSNNSLISAQVRYGRHTVLVIKLTSEAQKKQSRSWFSSAVTERSLSSLYEKDEKTFDEVCLKLNLLLQALNSKTDPIT